MVATLRGEGAAAPEYGELGVGADEFTIELHHGGFFVGFAETRTYLDGKVAWFDRVECDTWSPLWLKDFVEQLGYDFKPTTKFYWLLPGKTQKDGLRIIATDTDTNVMTSVVSKIKTLVLYVDHEDNIGGVQWDDIVDNPIAELPNVISPAKVQYVARRPGEKLPVFYTDLKKVKVEQGQTSREDVGQDVSDGSDVEDFVDSDYEVDEADNDLVDNEVEITSMKGNKKAKGCQLKASEMSRPVVEIGDEDDSENESIGLPDSDGEGDERLSFRSFKDSDLKNPEFHVGMTFPSFQKLREAITEYSIANRVEIKLPRNDNRRLRAHCTTDCPWNMYASLDSRTNSILIKTYYGVHTCQKEWVLKRLTAQYFATKYIDLFRANDNMSLGSFGRTVQRDLNVIVKRSKLGRVRRLILDRLHGDEVQQYNYLWDYGHELRRSNPGSSFYLNLKGNMFSTCYMSIDACKRGFLAACRPVICLDGCHIKTAVGGQLLTAVGIDPNDCIFPIAMAIVEVESLASWKWFLETLKKDLNIINTAPWTIMTDKQKGLIPAVQQVFPNSEHRFCVRHLYSNFQEKFKGENLKNQLWACARSSSIEAFKRNMDRMKELDKDAYEWLYKLAPNTWVRAYFSEFPKCDILLNNNCEVFNKYILDARELPILSMFEKIKTQLMSRHYNKQQEMQNDMLQSFCPKIRSKLAKNAKWANMCFALPSGQGVFQVQVRDYQHIVDITAQTCDCRRWQLTGVPCSHAIACLRHERIKPESVLPACYSMEAFKNAYGWSIWPCKDKSQWEKVGGAQVLPPLYEKKVGRPPKSRKKKPQEVQGKQGPRLTKHGVTMHCRHCSEPNHNAGGCKLKKMGFSSEDAKQLVARTQAQLHAEREEAARAEAESSVLPSFEPINMVVPGSDLDEASQQESTTLLSQMMSQDTQTTQLSVPQGPLPDSDFIMSNPLLQRPVPLNTSTKAGRAAIAKKSQVAKKGGKEPAAKKAKPSTSRKK